MEKILKDVHFGHLMDIPESVILNLMEVSADWERYGSNRIKNYRTWDEWRFSGDTINIPEKYLFLAEIVYAMFDKVKEIHKKDVKETLIAGSMVLCYYKDGSWATGSHRHKHRTLTVSIGFPREFTVNSKKVLMQSGDFIDINKHAHGVPKMDTESTGPRFSLNLFYLLGSDVEHLDNVV